MTIIINFLTREIKERFFPIKEGWKTFRVDQEQIWRKGIPLPESSFRSNFIQRRPVQKDRIPHRLDVVHNLLNPTLVETHFPHSLSEITPLDSVIGLAHIKVHSNKFFSPYFVINRVNILEPQRDIVRNEPSRNEGWLSGRYDGVKHIFSFY